MINIANIFTRNLNLGMIVATTNILAWLIAFGSIPLYDVFTPAYDNLRVIFMATSQILLLTSYCLLVWQFILIVINRRGIRLFIVNIILALLPWIAILRFTAD